jgi:hypothetical protein
MGILDGVVFHSEVFDTQPRGMSKVDFMYDMSIGTDYAVNFARDRYCARIPLDREKMGRVVNYLNAINAPYRSGKEIFNWNILENNCSHLAHNILALVGVWDKWGTDRPFIVALLDFPVPKNEFVNLMWRTNDMPLADPDALYADPAARAEILEQGWVPTRPGGLAEAERAVRPNEVYNTNLRLIFYDEPVFGHYQKRWEAMFRDPRYTDLHANLNYFSALYASILAQRPAVNSAPATGDDKARFRVKYRDMIAAEQAKLANAMALLSAKRLPPAVPGQRS